MVARTVRGCARPRRRQPHRHHRHRPRRRHRRRPGRALLRRRRRRSVGRAARGAARHRRCDGEDGRRGQHLELDHGHDRRQAVLAGVRAEPQRRLGGERVGRFGRPPSARRRVRQRLADPARPRRHHDRRADLDAATTGVDRPGGLRRRGAALCRHPPRRLAPSSCPRPGRRGCGRARRRAGARPHVHVRGLEPARRDRAPRRRRGGHRYRGGVARIDRRGRGRRHRRGHARAAHASRWRSPSQSCSRSAASSTSPNWRGSRSRCSWSISPRVGYADAHVRTSHRNPRWSPSRGDELESVGEVGVADQGEQAVGDRESMVRGAHHARGSRSRRSPPSSGAPSGGPAARAADRSRASGSTRRAATPPGAASPTSPAPPARSPTTAPSSSTSTGSIVAFARNCSNNESAIGIPAISAGPCNGTATCRSGRPRQ